MDAHSDNLRSLSTVDLNLPFLKLEIRLRLFRVETVAVPQ